MEQQQAYVKCILISAEQMNLMENCHRGIFKQWHKERLCNCHEDPKNLIRIELKGNAAKRRENFKTILDKMEECGQGNTNFPIYLEIYLPQNLCGYVIGKNGKAIKTLNENFNVRAYINVNEHSAITVPDGFALMKMEGFRPANVREGFFDVQRMVEWAANWPFETKGKTTSEFQDEVKIPAFSTMSENQMVKLDEFVQTFGLETFKKPCKFGDQFEMLVISGNDKLQVTQAARKLREFVKGVDWKEEGKIGQNENAQSGNNTMAKKPSSPIKNAEKGQRIVPTSPIKKLSTLPPQISKPIPKPPAKRVLNVMRTRTIPQRVVSVMLANNGIDFQKLQKQFGVKMRFQGDNYLDYPEGRTLEIYAESEEMIDAVLEHIRKVYMIDKKRHERYQKTIPTDGDRTVIVPCAMLLKNCYQEWAAGLKKRTGITNYAYQNVLPDGFRPVIFQGPKEAVELAEQEMRAKVKEFNQNCRPAAIPAFEIEEDDLPIPSPPNGCTESSAHNKLQDDLISIFTFIETPLVSNSTGKGAKEKPAVDTNKMPANITNNTIIGAIQKMEEKIKCAKCKIAERTVIFLPCMHFLICGKCALDEKKCPKCGETGEKQTVKYE